MDAFGFSRRDLCASLGSFAFVVTVFAVLRWLVQYPIESEWQFAICIAFGAALLPAVFKILAFLKTSRSSLDIAGVKIDFSNARTLPSFRITTALRHGDINMHDSGNMEVVNAARLLEDNAVVIVDLEDGKAWYRTRLLGVVAPSLTLGLRRTVVFLHRGRRNSQAFLGFADAATIASRLLDDPIYRQTYSLAVANYYQNGCVDQYSNTFGAPALAVTVIDRARHLELPPNSAPWIDANGVEDLLGKALHSDAIDLDTDDGTAVIQALAADIDNIAAIEKNEFKGLIPMSRIVRDVLRKLADGS